VATGHSLALGDRLPGEASARQNFICPWSGLPAEGLERQICDGDDRAPVCGAARPARRARVTGAERLLRWLFSNSGHGVKLSVKILAGSMVLFAVGRALRMMA